MLIFNAQSTTTVISGRTGGSDSDRSYSLSDSDSTADNVLLAIALGAVTTCLSLPKRQQQSCSMLDKRVAEKMVLKKPSCTISESEKCTILLFCRLPSVIKFAVHNKVTSGTDRTGAISSDTCSLLPGHSKARIPRKQTYKDTTSTSAPRNNVHRKEASGGNHFQTRSLRGRKLLNMIL